MELQTICWYGGIGRRNRLKICRTFVRAGSSPATSIVMNRNPQFQLAAEVDSFFTQKPYNRIGRRNPLVKVHMRRDVAVPEPFLDFLQAYPI